MYWRGIVIRCGEHAEQTTLPHFLLPCKHDDHTMFACECISDNRVDDVGVEETTPTCNDASCKRR